MTWLPLSYRGRLSICVHLSRHTEQPIQSCACVCVRFFSLVFKDDLIAMNLRTAQNLSQKASICCSPLLSPFGVGKQKENGMNCHSKAPSRTEQSLFTRLSAKKKTARDGSGISCDVVNCTDVCVSVVDAPTIFIEIPFTIFSASSAKSRFNRFACSLEMCAVSFSVFTSI